MSHETSHKNLGQVIPPFPMPVCLVGATVDGKPNFLAIAFFSGATSRPPTMSVVLEKKHHTSRGIRESGSYSVCIPGEDNVAVTDYCGIFSGKNVDKSDLFDVFYGDLKTAPMIREFPVNVECRLTQVVDVGSNEMFIGEIVGTYISHEAMTDGKPDMDRINPFLLDHTSLSYRGMGNAIARAWKVGKEFKPEKK